MIIIYLHIAKWLFEIEPTINKLSEYLFKRVCDYGYLNINEHLLFQ